MIAQWRLFTQDIHLIAVRALFPRRTPPRDVTARVSVDDPLALDDRHCAAAGAMSLLVSLCSDLILESPSSEQSAGIDSDRIAYLFHS